VRVVEQVTRGSEIAVEAAKSGHRTWLAGPDRGAHGGGDEV
jgi:hypothetical protein